MSSMTFVVNDTSTGGNNPLVQIDITENPDGTLTFNVTQLVFAGGYLGDLRGLFFDVADESLIGSLSIMGAPTYLTEFRQGNDTVADLGQGANMQGLLGSDGGYDVGIEIGTQGIGKNGNDVRSFAFTLDSAARNLTLNDLANVDFGVRITSVGQDIDGNGTIDTTRNNSSKIGETTDPITGNTDDGDATVTITGTAQEDSVLTANFGNNDPDGAASGITYQWQRNGTDIDGATASTYLLGDDDVGATITVVVGYTDGQGFAETIESAAVGPIANVEDEATGTLKVTGTAQEGGSLTADTGGLATLTAAFRPLRPTSGRS